MSRWCLFLAALFAVSVAQAAPITYRIVDQKTDRNPLFPNGMLLGSSR